MWCNILYIIYIYNHLSIMIVIYCEEVVRDLYLESMEIFRLLKRETSGLWTSAAKRLHGKLLLSPSENNNMYITPELKLTSTGMIWLFAISVTMICTCGGLHVWHLMTVLQTTSTHELREIVEAAPGQKWSSGAILIVDTSKPIIQLPAL